MKKKYQNKKILITGAGSLIGEGVIKSIKNFSSEILIIGTDYFKESASIYWCDKSFLLPDILKRGVSEKIWLKKIIRLSLVEKINLIIPCADFEIPLFAKYKNYIEKESGSVVLVSNLDLVKQCNDKFETAKLLENIGFNYPTTIIPNKDMSNLKKIKYPFIIKPRSGSTSKNVSIVKNKNELKKALISCKSPVAQEFLEGDEYTCGSIYIDDEVKSVICLKRKLKNGNTSIAFSDNKKTLNKYIFELTKILKPFGPMNFQLKMTKKGPYIFEINPRFSGTTPIRGLFGINELEIVYNSIFLKKTVKHKIKKGISIKFSNEFYLKEREYKKIQKL